MGCTFLLFSCYVYVIMLYCTLHEYHTYCSSFFSTLNYKLLMKIQCLQMKYWEVENYYVCITSSPPHCPCLQIVKRDRKAYIINVSKEYSIVSQFTSFVAIEEREKVSPDMVCELVLQWLFVFYLC